VLVPQGGDAARARALRAEGWITVAALLPAADWEAEARRLACGYLLEGGKPRPVAG
jgi:ATP phosphoribosyltransferase regulatory subunit